MNDIILAVKAFKKAHPYRGSYDEKHKKFRCVLKVISYYYSVPEPNLYITDHNKPLTFYDHFLEILKGEYCIATNTIALRKFSVVSLLHEFRHLLQCNLTNINIIDDDYEEDANIWSHLIYKAVFPRNFVKLKAEGELNPTRHRI